MPRLKAAVILLPPSEGKAPGSVATVRSATRHAFPLRRETAERKEFAKSLGGAGETGVFAAAKTLAEDEEPPEAPAEAEDSKRRMPHPPVAGPSPPEA